ncbi:uncharacterized protein LOC129602250 [Paramacrobiotus metropolitanus]|uniref:uncharacterized protein LOC129602250 n=1 Tax=Paramacrobiotus metropolitanus TaxID=2943436 RepID=UPI0024461A83|nr:uncharacterized protein LOC129602250 [Paramacrobiotus metropolitanus]
MSLVPRPRQDCSEKQLGKLSLSDTKLPFRHQEFSGRSSLGNKNMSSLEGEHNANAVARHFSGGFGLLQAGNVAENLVAAFLGAHRRVLQKVRILPNAQQLLDVCEGYRGDVFALLAGRFLPSLPSMWTTAAAPSFAPAFPGLDFSLRNNFGTECWVIAVNSGL